MDLLHAPEVQHSAPEPSRRVPAFDGLRGVAALLVLLHHALQMLPAYAAAEWLGGRAEPTHGAAEWLLLGTPLRFLWMGEGRAILFFVLSGFVLSLPWLEGRATRYKRFLLGRFCRIYPPYLVIMILAAAGSLALGGHKLPRATMIFNLFGWASSPGLAAVPSVGLMLNNRASSFLDAPVWSLVWEARVSLILPLLLLPVARWRNRGILVALVLLEALDHVIGWLIGPALSATLNEPQSTFYNAEFFVLGIAVAANRHRLAVWFGGRSEAAAILLLAVGVVLSCAPWPVARNRFVGLGAAVLLAAILVSPVVQRCLTNRKLLWLGARSYSLYLMHMPLIMLTVIAFHGGVPGWACGAVMPVAIAVSALFHRWAERPSVAATQWLTGYQNAVRPRARVVVGA